MKHTSLNLKHLYEKIRIKNKLIVCIVLFLIISMNLNGICSLAAVSTLKDIQGHWAQNDIQKAVDIGFVHGYPDLTFKPDKEVTRAEFVSMLNAAFSIPASGTSSNFKDVKSSDWFANSVWSLENASYINGYPDSTFRPNDYITREQCALIIYNITGIAGRNNKVFEDSSQIADWSRHAVESLASADILTGYTDGFFYPVKNVTRAEAVVMINRAKDYISEISRGDIDRNNEGKEVINYVWIWRLPKCEGGNIDALIQKAKTLHIGYVIKTHDGNQWWQEQADAITKITAAGVPCGAWGYCYGNHVQDEINYVQDSFEAGASFYVADVEKEYGNINMRDTAQQFMSAISRFGPVDYTSYAYPTYHSAVPFDIFNQYARYAIPQCYWKYIGDSPQKCYDRAVREYKATGAKNVAPMGMMCDNVAVDEIKQFKNLCGNSGTPVFWWDYQEASPQMLDALLPDPK